MAPTTPDEGGGPGQCRDDCDCLECVEATPNNDGTVTVVISSATCKDGTISWMCCIGASEGGVCDVDNSQPGCEADKEKCEEVDLLYMVVDEGATSVTIQVRSIFAGPFACPACVCVSVSV